MIKLKEGLEHTIDLGFSPENLAILERSFKDIVKLMDIGGSLSDGARQELRKLYK